MRLATSTISIFLLFLNATNGAKILAVFQMPSFSHHQVFRPIVRELSLRGHQVTSVTPFPIKDKNLVNLTEIDVGPEIFAWVPKANFAHFLLKEYPIQDKMPLMMNGGNNFAEEILKNKDFVKIYNNSQTKFDLIIAQAYVTPTLYALAAKLNTPFVGINSMGAWVGSHFALGNPNHPALHSEMYLPYQWDMSLFERIRMTLYNIWARLYLNLVAWPQCDRLAKKYLGNDLPYISEIEKNMSMLFITANHIISDPRPTVPSIVQIEHVHVEPPKALPKDLKDLLDSAKEGVVYFSLGSNVRSANTSQKLRDNLIAAFAELPYKILWKFEDDSLPNQPKNVIIRKWLPQADILAHPNIKVFFSQCGLQSIEESLDRGVPLVVMPFISDQELNSRRMVAREVAIELDYLTATKDDIKNAILEVAENPKYRQNMKKLKDLWLDHPMTAMDRVIWWMEYVIRHNGARHLKSPTAGMSWIKFLLIDVILTVFAGVFLAGFVLVKALKLLVSMFFGKKKVKKS